ncbi:MAG: hypothetical protein CL537_14210 [Alcanivoracaceae bacterium]|nr:hypothetical protein [Alcanivoracaceae bacterium]MCG8436452.1 hypothetical protein [Pseudomonadales bacterium]MED5431177.1 hypothetical protein [Pseudomonadota bacterium]
MLKAVDVAISAIKDIDTDLSVVGQQIRWRPLFDSAVATGVIGNAAGIMPRIRRYLGGIAQHIGEKTGK